MAVPIFLMIFATQMDMLFIVTENIVQSLFNICHFAAHS